MLTDKHRLDAVVLAIVAERLGLQRLSPSTITPPDRPVRYELALALEEEMDVELSAADVSAARVAQDWVNMVRSAAAAWNRRADRRPWPIVRDSEPPSSSRVSVF